MKKGFAIAFNWIFAVLAGGLIFLFLGFFAAQNTDLFGKVTTIRVGESLNVAFSGLKTGLVDTNLEFDKEIELEFSCFGEGFQRLKVNGKEGRDLYDNLIFSPGKLKDFEFRIFTSSWKVPYRVDNFIFVLDDSIFSLIGDVPRNKFDDFDVNYRNAGGKIVNFKETDETNIRCNRGRNEVNYQIDGEMYGTICGENFGPLYFYGDAMVYAFVFGEQFECLYPKMQEKLEIMSEVYREKIQDLPLGICEGNYLEMNSAIRNMVVIDEDFYEKVNLVQSKNDRIIGAGCVEVF